MITLNSSNLELAIDKALSLSESLEKIWVDGNLKQRQKLSNRNYRPIEIIDRLDKYKDRDLDKAIMR